MDRDTDQHSAGGGRTRQGDAPRRNPVRKGGAAPAAPGDVAGGSAIGEAKPIRLSLAELTDAADVSVRTVRYYIAEGLLPPPAGAGPSSAYSRGHLDRLRLIQRLKEAYLPLKEIRRQLAGLDDAQVRAILERTAEERTGDPWRVPDEDETLAGAREYLALLESREQYRVEPMTLTFPEPEDATAPAPSAAMFKQPNQELGAAARPLSRSSQPEAGQRQEAADAGLWRRIPLGDGAELVIADRVYARHRDRIDWLVRWARKVFD